MDANGVALDGTLRRQLRTLIDEARRTELDAQRRLRRLLRERSPDEVKRQTAARKAILAAADSHDSSPFAVVARSEDGLLLVSVGAGLARAVDFRVEPPRISEPSDLHAFLGTERDWTAFEDDPATIFACVDRMLETGDAGAPCNVATVIRVTR
jgi:hypothetical protein